MQVYFQMCDCAAESFVELSCIPREGDHIWLNINLFSAKDRQWFLDNQEEFIWIDDNVIEAECRTEAIFDFRDRQPKVYVYLRPSD